MSPPPGTTTFTGTWPIGHTVHARIAPLVKMRVIAYGFSGIDGSSVMVQTRWVNHGEAQTQWWHEHELDADDT